MLDEREDFIRNPASARFAINSAITAWQLHEWVYAERHRYEFMSRFQSKKEFKEYLYKKERDFRIIHDLADGAKHYELTSRATSIISTTVSTWKDVNKIREVEDTTSQLFLTFKFSSVGMTMSFDDLLYVITFFWYKFFKEQLKADIDGLFVNYTAF